jgi:hypothetical protein
MPYDSTLGLRLATALQARERTLLAFAGADAGRNIDERSPSKRRPSFDFCLQT